jgi:hypothetical protein
MTAEISFFANQVVDIPTRVRRVGTEISSATVPSIVTAHFTVQVHWEMITSIVYIHLLFTATLQLLTTADSTF